VDNYFSGRKNEPSIHQQFGAKPKYKKYSNICKTQIQKIVKHQPMGLLKKGTFRNKDLPKTLGDLLKRKEEHSLQIARDKKAAELEKQREADPSKAPFYKKPFD